MRHGVGSFAAGRWELSYVRMFMHQLQQLVLWYTPAVGMLEDCVGRCAQGWIVNYEKTA